jgi:hypothetical protein
MAKASITNITTTQTFQNWFDKTNEIVDLFRNETLTASVGSPDVTNGDAFLNGEFEAERLVANTSLRVNLIDSLNGTSTIDIDAPIKVTNGTTDILATFSYTADGGKVAFTDETLTWNVGMEDNVDQNFIIDTGVGTTRFELTPAGTLTVPNLIVVEDFVANNIFATGDLVTQYSASDLKLKENLEVIPDALDKVSQISGYTFNYKNKPDERVTGVVAQELENILPGIVFNTSDESGNFKAVRYGNIVALLIEAIKELKDEVERLKDGSSD